MEGQECALLVCEELLGGEQTLSTRWRRDPRNEQVLPGVSHAGGWGLPPLLWEPPCFCPYICCTGDGFQQSWALSGEVQFSVGVGGTLQIFGLGALHSPQAGPPPGGSWCFRGWGSCTQCRPQPSVMITHSARGGLHVSVCPSPWGLGHPWEEPQAGPGITLRCWCHVWT